MSADAIIGLVAGGLSLTQLLTLAKSIKVSHAKLTVVDKGAKSRLGSDAELVFQFNPSTLRLSHSPDWSDGLTQSIGPRPIRYGGQPTQRLNFTMLLDESEYKGGTAASIVTALMPFHGVSDLLGFVVKNDNNVLAMVKQLQNFTLPMVWSKTGLSTSGEGIYQKRPPIICLEWGPITFNGIIDELETEFLLFDQEGGPRRATIDVTMRGMLDSDVSGLVEVMAEAELKKKQEANITEVKTANQLSSGLGGNNPSSGT